ncbi:MAG: bacillithiol biosynthesis cysteine-adding enzyme BshC [Desulfitobacteriaceae bacterium]
MKLKNTGATCFEQVAFFFSGGDPKEQVSFSRRAKQLREQSYDRESLVEVLEDYHKRLGAGAKTFDNLSLLKREDSLAIVTGQQAGFLTGPLYTIYKAMTTVQLAEIQSRELGCPVIPIFWIASEDHDWAEIQQTVFLDQAGKPLVCHMPGEGGGRSIGRLSVPSWEEIFPQLESAFPESEFRLEVFEKLQYFTNLASNLGEWFALILQWLLKDRGLIFFDPLLPEFKRLAAPIYEKILRSHSQVGEAFESRTVEWRNLGQEPQIHQKGESINLFMEDPERRALLWNENGFYLRGKKESLTLERLCVLIQNEPERFSPNVVTRPIVQDYLLPTLAYIPGPGELNYWAQLGGVFQVLGLEMPVLFPRLSAVVLTPAWHKALETEHLSIEQVYQGLSDARERSVRELDDFDIEGTFNRARQEIKEVYTKLYQLEKIHANIPDLLHQNQDKVNGQIDYLETKIWQAQKKRNEGSLRRFQLLENGLAPKGHKQERLLNPLNFVMRFGPDFVEKIAELPLKCDFQEQIILL